MGHSFVLQPDLLPGTLDCDGCSTEPVGFAHGRFGRRPAMFYAKFFAKRFVAIVITLAAVIAISYIMMYCSPGGFMNTTQLASSLAPLAAQDPAAYQKLMEQFQLRYGLNLPLWHQ